MVVSTTRRFPTFLLVGLVVALLAGCSTGSTRSKGRSTASRSSSSGSEASSSPPAESKSLEYGADAKKIYDRGLAAFNGIGCDYAVHEFEDIRKRYPYSRYAALSELRLADCQLRQNDHLLAIQAYRRFIRQRPTHAEVPYAHFAIAKAYASQIPPDIFFMPPPHELDPNPAREALRAARRFVVDYPLNENVREAKKFIDRSLAVLAGHELYVARFYAKRSAHQGVVQRVKTMMVTYPDNPYRAEGLLLMGEAYVALKDKPQARATLTELVDALPKSTEAGRARTLLRELGAAVGEPNSNNAKKANGEGADAKGPHAKGADPKATSTTGAKPSAGTPSTTPATTRSPSSSEEE